MVGGSLTGIVTLQIGRPGILRNRVFVTIRLVALVFLVLATNLSIAGQQTPTTNPAESPTSTPTPTPTPTPSKESEPEKTGEGFSHLSRIKPRNPSVSNPADFNTPGVLQIEYGYGGYFRGNGFRSQHTGTLSVLYAASERIGIEFDLDTVASQQDSQLFRMTGIGDSRFGVQIDIAGETGRLPSFAVSYFAKLPSASVSKNLGTGRVDHLISALFSKRIGKYNVDFDAGFIINGKPGEKGFVTGGQFALGIGRDLTENFNVQVEVFGESKDSEEPQGLFAAGNFSYKINERVSFNAELKIGLTAASPRVGVAAGFSYSFPSFFKKRN